MLTLATGAIQYAESKKLLKLAAAAAIIRGGPIIPIPVRYPVHVPHSKTVKVPIRHPVPIKVPVSRYSHSVEKVRFPVHSHSVLEKHVPVYVPAHIHSQSHSESIGHFDHDDEHGWDLNEHEHENYGGHISYAGHDW